MVLYSHIDRYWEVFCGKGDTVEIPSHNGVVSIASIVSCSISTIDCQDEFSSIFSVSRKSILSMAHTSQQMNSVEIQINDIVSITSEEERPTIDLGVVTRITGNLGSLYYLTGGLKGNVYDVWIKRLSFIGRGFSIEKYQALKEFKLSLEYQSLYTYQNTSLIPQQFQEEIGIPKIMYTIGGKFPLVASLSGKLTNSKEIKSHDDSECIGNSKPKKRKKASLRFFSYEGQSSDGLSNTERERVFPSMLKSYHDSLASTKERLVRAWLNINEKVSSKSQMMKEQTNEKYVFEEVDIPSIEYNQYTQVLNESRSDYGRYTRSTIRRCPPTKHMRYTNQNIHLQPIPIVNESSSEKKLCFCINVICHEYS